MSNASATRRKTAQEAPSSQPVLRAETVTDQNPRKFACPNCHSQQAISGRHSTSWISRFFMEPFHCIDCGSDFRKVPLRVWFALLFLTWSLAMLAVTLLK